MLKSSECNYGDAYVFVKGRITITGAGADAVAWQADERDKGVIFRYCTPFTNCISEINNTHIDNEKDLDVVMPIIMSDNCSKVSGSLWKYYKDEPNNNLTDSESFKSKIKITGITPAAGDTKDIEIAVPLHRLSNFKELLKWY